MNRGEITKTVVSYVTDAAERINHYMVYKGIMDFMRKKCPYLSQFLQLAARVDFSILSKPCTLFVVMDDKWEVPADIDPEDYLLGCLVSGVVVTDMIAPGKIWGIKTKNKHKDIFISKQGSELIINGKAKVVHIFENFRDGSLVVVDQNFQ